MTAQSHDRTKVFISYSHQDAEWLQRLRIHLKPLERDHGIEIWDDTRIKPGSKWREEITQALATAKVAVLLVSADFLASDFIAADELPPLLSAAEKDGATILPVILSPSRFLRNRSLTQFQAVNDPSRPLISLAKSDQEAVLVKVSEAIESSLKNSPNIDTQRLQEDQTTGSHALTRQKSSEVGSESIRETDTARENGGMKFLRLNPMIWVAIIGGIVALVTGYWQFVYKSAHAVSGTPVQYAGRVIDANTQQVIRGAKVSVEAQGVPQIYYTDSDGVFYLKLRDSIDTARIRVEASGYEVFDRNVSLSRSGIEDVRLKSTAAAEAAALSGVVVQDNGKPIQGAQVTIDEVPGMKPVETSSDGVFSINNIPRKYGEQVRIQVVKEGYQPNPHTEDVVLGKAPPKVILRRAR